MTTYVFDKKLGKIVEKGSDRTTGPHYVISDSMDQLRHPVTGRVYDSKSRFRADTKAAGCEEVGNEKMEPRPTPIDRNKRRSVLRDQLRNMTDSQAGEIMNQLERQFRR